MQENPPHPSAIANRAEFAETLSALRALSGVSFRALGRAVDLPPSTVSGWTSGKHLPYPRQQNSFKQLVEELGATAEQAAAWVEALRRVQGTVEPRDDSQSPYPGLERYDAEDARWFFGREDVVASVIDRLRTLMTRHHVARMVVVTGASGAGKSSIVRAGVVPAITDGALGEAGTATLVSTPAEMLGRLPDIAAGTTWVIDQFEEVFTSLPDEAAQRRFLDHVLGVASAPGGVSVVLCLRSDYFANLAAYPVYAPILQDQQVVVSTMTTDQLRRAIVEPARLAGTSVDEELVELLLRDFAPGAGSPDAGALPLLSHALLETWKLARRGQMKLADYRAVGGIAGALEQTAEAAFASFDARRQEIAKTRLLRLVNLGDDGVATRRRVAIDDLLDDGSADTSGDAAEVEDVVDHFVAQRLLTADESTVAVSHEVLLTAWPRLRAWIDEDREGLVHARRLRDAARSWEESGRDPMVLVAGSRLQTLETWASSDRVRGQLGVTERSFLEASRHREARTAASKRRRRRVLVGLTAVSVVLALLATTAAVVAVGARDEAERERNEALSRKVALQAMQVSVTDAALAAQLALAAYRTAPTVDSRSALMDVSAMALPQRLFSNPGSIALAVSPDEELMAVSDAVEGVVHLMRLEGGKAVRWLTVPAVGEGTEYFALAISPDKRFLAAGGTNLGVRLWAIDEDGVELLDDGLGLEVSGVQTLAFSPDGRSLAAGGLDEEKLGLVARWSLTADGAATRDMSSTSGTLVKAVAWSPDGRFLLSGDDGGAMRVWDAATGSELATFEPAVEGDQLHTLAVRPDGAMVAAGYRGGTVRVFEMDGDDLTEVEGPVTEFTSWVNTLGFDSTGTRLAAGSSDSTVHVWTVAGWEPVRTAKHPGPVTGVAFVNNDADLAAVSTDGAVRLWPLTGSPLPGARANIFNLSFTADGTRMAVFPGGADGTSQLWDTSDLDSPVPVDLRIAMPEELGRQSGAGAITPDGRVMVAGTSAGPSQLWRVDGTGVVPDPRILEGATDLIEMVAASPDSRFVAAGSDDSTLHIWDVSDPAGAALASVVDDATSQVLGVEWNMDGSLLATASADTFVYLYDFADPSAPKLLARLDGFESYAQDVAFSDDGTLLAAGSADKTVRVWDISNPAEPVQVGDVIGGPQNYVYSVDFQPGSRLLAAASTDGTAWMWDLADPAAPEHRATLTVPEGQLFVVAFSPDGSTLLAGGSDRVVFVWPVDTDAASDALCSIVGDPMTAEEWNLYIPERSFEAPCG